MKKILCLMLILMVAGGILFAGGKSDSGSSGKTRVEMWGHQNESWNNSHKAIMQRFNASQSEIEVIGTFFPWDEFEAKIQTSLMASAAGADIYEIWGGWAIDFVDGNALAEVPSALMRDLISDSYEPVLGTLQKSGRYYGVPVEFNNEFGGMLVDKQKFQAAGISYPKTWNEIIDVAKRTTVRRGDIFDVRGLDFTTEDTLCAFFLSTILSNGGQYWVNNRFNFQTAQARAAWQTLVDYVVVDRITNLDSTMGGDSVESWQFIGRGEAMMVPRGPWVIGELEEEYGKHLGVDFDYVGYPFRGPTPAFIADTGWSMAVSRATKAPDAAWKYVTYFLEPANMLQHNLACNQLPARKSIAQNPNFVRQVPHLAPLLDILQYGKFIGPFNSGVLKECITQAFVTHCNGGYPNAEAALRALENQVNSELRL